MTKNRAQRRDLERKQRKLENKQDVSADPLAFDKRQPLWLLLLVALPIVIVPVYFLYMPPGAFVEGGAGHIVINEYQKYVALLVTLGVLVLGGGGYLVLKNYWPRLPRAILWPVLLFEAGVLISLFLATDMTMAGLVGFEVYLLPVLFFLLVASLSWSRPQVLAVTVAALIASLVVSLIGIAQSLEIWEGAQTLPHNRAGSLMFSTNLAGEYLITLIPLVAVISLISFHRLIRFFSALTCLLLMSHLVLTYARGAWVGLAGGLMLTIVTALTGICLVKRSKGVGVEKTTNAPVYRKTAFALGAIISLFLLLVVGVSYHPVSGKYSGTSPIQELMNIKWSGGSGRQLIWSDSLEMLKNDWVGGVGPGHYRNHFHQYWDKVLAKGERQELVQWDDNTGVLISPLRPHNDYLQNWLEIGFLGLVGTLWLFGTIFWLSAKGIGQSVLDSDNSRALLIFGSLAGFAAWAVSMLFEFPFRMPASLLLGWFCAGLAVSLSLAALNRQLWKPVLPAVNRLAGLIVIGLAFFSFLFAHRVFWGDVYGIQAINAWNRSQIEKGYEWQSKAYDYAPWVEYNGLTKARMEYGLEQYEDALNTADEMLQRNPYSLPGLWTQGYAALANTEQEKGQTAFKTISELYPFLQENKKHRSLAGLPSEEK